MYFNASILCRRHESVAAGKREDGVDEVVVAVVHVQTLATDAPSADGRVIGAGQELGGGENR